MTTITVNAEHGYNVVIDTSWQQALAGAIHSRTRAAFIYSENMREQVRIPVDSECEIHYFELPDGESAKTATTLHTLWNWLGAAGFTRSDLIVGIGGGTITDVAGFAAASWLRGIDWVAIPTTLAAMVDAAVGGKTGINSDYGKNLIGAFHSPLEVVVDTSWLPTLSDRDFAAGLAEVIKCGFIADARILDLIQDRNIQSIRNDAELVVELITRAVAVKASVVGIDFKENFDREILNYGHTLGHAVEIDSAYALRHGEAVSIGLVFAAQLAHIKGILDHSVVERHKQILEAVGLPITYPLAAWQRIYPLLSLDKKARGRTLRFVAITAIASVVRIEDANESELMQAYERISS